MLFIYGEAQQNLIRALSIVCWTISRSCISLFQWLCKN